MAKKINVAKPTICRYESGVISNVPFDKVEDLAKALDTNPAWLMGWSNEKKYNEYSDVLNKYNNLDEHGKEIVKYILENEYRRCNKKREI